MSVELKDKALRTNTREQRGAALLTVLLISTLLLGAGGTLLLVTATSSRTAIDSTAEMQAYYSAEAGLQASLNVLRGNIAPNGAMPAGTQITFRNAVTVATSNLPTDTTGTPRLSGWLNYTYTPSGAANADRVALSPTVGYTPRNGLAYSVAVSDPDNVPAASGEPTRLLLRVTGYGPKGAIKNLELIVNRSNFNYSPPATIMMRGADDCTPITFDIGDSNAKDYSGHDHAAGGTAILPAFGATCGGDQTIEATADTKATVETPKAATIGNSDLPPWLQSADQARAFLADQKANAIMQGRYFSSLSGYSGSSGAPAFTFVDGNCTLDGGAGLLIVTGNLEMNGNPNFDGLILVLGAGTVNRDGGGNGDVYGAISVARFDPTGTGGFLAPTFHTNGAGNSTIQYDSRAVQQALNLSGPRTLGIHEF
jgi:Tfp pilus assembly protein PilX